MPPKKFSSSATVVLYWHRTDLRIYDSPALQAALDLDPAVFIPVWTWDPHYVYHTRVGPNRWRFLIECQQDLSQSYTKINSNQKLWVVREAPQSVLPKLWEAWGISHLVFEKDTDAYARERDEQVMKLAKEAGVKVISKMGRTLFDSDELVRKNGGEPTMSMSQVQKAAEKINQGNPEKPLDAPKAIPNPWSKDKMDLSSIAHEVPESDPDLNIAYRSAGKDHQYKQLMGPNKDFAVPTLEELGIDPSQARTSHRGGETLALKVLAQYLQDEDYVGTFEKPRTSPASFEPQATTLLSPHLHFGSLSVRRFWWDVQGVLDRRIKQRQHTSSLPVNLPGQLLFRDMYFAAQAALGHSFSQTYGNRIVRFVPWHLQSTLTKTTDGRQLPDGSYTVDSREAEDWFRRWKEGRTGFPWIDSLMRQLKQEGWIHHLGRHSVACFLTRGGCYVSWERGAEVFQEWLIDHEEACNIGNWMWLSCTAFFSQFYRCYSPIAFGKKWDPEGHFVRRYCPELKDYNKKYIYEPWRAPIQDQKKWGCRTSGDGTSTEDNGLKLYPKPMFDFDKQRQFCIDSIKHAYDIGLHGNDSMVMDGSWKELFEFDDTNAEVKDATNGSVDKSERPNKRRKTVDNEAENECYEDGDGEVGDDRSDDFV